MDDAGPPSVIAAALVDLRESAGLEGVAAIDTSDVPTGPTLLYVTGLGGQDVLQPAAQLMRNRPWGPSTGLARGKRPLLVSPWILPPGRPGGLALWRAAGERAWDVKDHGFAVSVSGLIRVMLENSPDESGLDRLTGLPNRLYFLDEADRHIDRLSQDRVPGTLMLVSLDEIEQLTRSYGRDAAQWALARVAALLRAMVRPTDLVARIGADVFALWLNGVDHMTAAERAESLCERRLTLPDSPGRSVVVAPSLSIGIASRLVGSDEDIRVLLKRAQSAVSRVRREGGSGWHVSQTK